MGDVLDDFLDENNASRALAPAAVLSQVLLMSGVSVRSTSIFCVAKMLKQDLLAHNHLCVQCSPASEQGTCCIHGVQTPVCVRTQMLQP